MENSKSPATKADISNLLQVVQTLRDEFIADISKRDARVAKLAADLKSEMEANTEYIKRYMDTLMENYLADLRGAAKDEFQMVRDRQSEHEARIRRVELHTGLVQA